MDRAEIDSSHGRDALAVLLVQDIAVVPLAVLLTVLSGGGAVGEVLLELGRILLLAAGLILALYVLLNVVAVWALGRLTIERNRELTVLLAIGTGLGSAYAAHAVGISPAMGAFVSGMFLGGSRFATQIRADVASLRVVLLTLFFGAAGMVADPIWIGQHALLVLGVTVLLVAGKAAIVWLVLGWAGRPTATAIASGLCLAQVGEFAFVLGSIGQHAGAVGESTYLLVVSCAITTLFLTPFVVPWAPTIGLRVARALGRRDPDASGVASGREPPTVVIVGFGPAGRLAAQALAGGNERVLVIDLNDTSRAAVEALGFQVEIGDARQFDVLEHARVEHAHTIVITVPDRSSALTILHHMHRMAPQATIIVRARYEQHRADFENACAHVVVGDEERVGTALADRIRGELPTRPAADAPTVG